MKLLWIVFGLAVLWSTLIISKLGLVLLFLLAVTFVGLPVVFVSLFIPAFTFLLGIYLFIRSIVGIFPGLKQRDELLLSGLSVAIAAGLLTGIPIRQNQHVDDTLPLATVEDMPLSNAKAPGSIVGLHSNPKYCDETCVYLLLGSPDVRVVLSRFEPIAENALATPPADSVTWGSVPKGNEPCDLQRGRNYLASIPGIKKAVEDGFCLMPVPMADRLDVVVQVHRPPAGAPGQWTEDTRTEMHIRQDDHLRLAYRATTGTRHKLSVPMILYWPLDYDLAAGFGSIIRYKDKIPLDNPVPTLSHEALLKAALPN